MRHKIAHRKFNRTSSHRRAMFRNLAINLITHKRIKSTDTKCKELRGVVEKLVTLARRGDLHSKRLVLAKLGNNRAATTELFDNVAPNYTDRPGGYTRIIKLGPRLGDAAEMSFIEFV